jgi:uncharacterized protein (TIGR01370 family)
MREIPKRRLSFTKNFGIQDFMKRIYLSILTLIVIGTISSMCADPAEVRPKSFLVYYGSSLNEQSLNKTGMAIVEPDNIDPKKYANKNAKLIAYLSVGEISPTRGYWPQVKGKDFLVEANPDWASYRIDIRSKEWQNFLLTTLIPSIVSKGFDGLFLDTVDTAAYLEWKNPKKFSGSKEAMAGFIKEIHDKFPNIEIYPNNGLELLPKLGSVIDGVVVEDVYTRYDFKKKRYEPTPVNEVAQKEQQLDSFKKSFNKPVLNILYETSANTSLAKTAIEKSRSKGYGWYLTTVDLMKVGTMDE